MVPPLLDWQTRLSLNWLCVTSVEDWWSVDQTPWFQSTRIVEKWHGGNQTEAIYNVFGDVLCVTCHVCLLVCCGIHFRGTHNAISAMQSHPSPVALAVPSQEYESLIDLIVKAFPNVVTLTDTKPMPVIITDILLNKGFKEDGRRPEAKSDSFWNHDILTHI